MISRDVGADPLQDYLGAPDDGMAITAASSTAGWAMNSFLGSGSTEEIPSPPELIASFERPVFRPCPCPQRRALVAQPVGT